VAVESNAKTTTINDLLRLAHNGTLSWLRTFEPHVQERIWNGVHTNAQIRPQEDKKRARDIRQKKIFDTVECKHHWILDIICDQTQGKKWLDYLKSQLKLHQN